MNKFWEPILGSLWKKSRFTSYFYQSVHFMENDAIPTLALTVYTSRLVMFYNREFIESLTEDETTGLLVHEMLHVIFNHDHRAIADGDIYLQNLAQDMVINSYILTNEKTFFSRKGQYVHDIPRIILPKGLPVIPSEFKKETGKMTLPGKNSTHGSKNNRGKLSNNSREKLRINQVSQSRQNTRMHLTI